MGEATTHCYGVIAILGIHSIAWIGYLLMTAQHTAVVCLPCFWSMVPKGAIAGKVFVDRILHRCLALLALLALVVLPVTEPVEA